MPPIKPPNRSFPDPGGSVLRFDDRPRHHGDRDPTCRSPADTGSERGSIFNGTRKNGTRTLYLSTYIAVPTPAWIMASAQIKQAHDGPYGTEAVISFPKIAGGSGSIASFNFRIKKRLPLEGKWYSPITARCPNGSLQFRDTATFFNYETSETFRARSEVLRTCAGG